MVPPLTDEDETTHKLLDDLWQRLLPQTAARLDLLDQAAADAARHALSPALQAEAAAIAHKFAGSLGMFGFHEGTRIALKLEAHLNASTPDPTILRTLTDQLHHSLADPELGVPATRRERRRN